MFNLSIPQWVLIVAVALAVGVAVLTLLAFRDRRKTWGNLKVSSSAEARWDAMAATPPADEAPTE